MFVALMVDSGDVVSKLLLRGRCYQLSGDPSRIWGAESGNSELRLSRCAGGFGKRAIIKNSNWRAGIAMVLPSIVFRIL
jgi:hypothetical protein